MDANFENCTVLVLDENAVMIGQYYNIDFTPAIDAMATARNATGPVDDDGDDGDNEPADPRADSVIEAELNTAVEFGPERAKCLQAMGLKNVNVLCSIARAFFNRKVSNKEVAAFDAKYRSDMRFIRSWAKGIQPATYVAAVLMSLNRFRHRLGEIITFCEIVSGKLQPRIEADLIPLRLVMKMNGGCKRRELFDATLAALEQYIDECVETEDKEADEKAAEAYRG
jgi:hypothetical protein